MFNPNTPNNSLPHLPANINYDSVKILKALWDAKLAIWRLDVLTQFLWDKEMFLTHFAIKESIESSSIEKIDSDYEDQLKAWMIKEQFMNKAQKEVFKYKEALMVWTHMVKKQWFLWLRNILEIWQVLNPTKSIIRTGWKLDIKKNETEVIYTPPTPDALNWLLGNFENYYNWMIEHDVDPLIKMAITHYQFEAIHPFYDWNGRTWRILMVLHLVLSKYLEFPIIFISGFINKNLGHYYKLLLEVTTKWNWEEFILYFLKAIEVQSYETINDINKIRALKDKFVTILSNDPVIKSVLAENIANVLISKPMLLKSDLEQFWSRNTISKYITQLIKIWILKEEKENIWNNRIYSNIEFIKLTN